MPDFTNIITVDLTEAIGFKVEAHKAVHQWDSGVVLQLTGVTLPSGCRAQFDTKTTTYNQELTDGACEIPNALLGYEMIGDIKCHVYVTDQDYGIVVYDIHIPVIRRPKPDSYIYTDNTSSENGWIKTDNGFKVNEGQTILGRTELSINDNQTILDGTSLSLNNQQTVLDGTHLSLASGLFYADSTHLQLNSGRITIGPNKMLVDSRVYGTVNKIDKSQLVLGMCTASDGSATADANRIYTKQLIAVKPNTTYTCKIALFTPNKPFYINWVLPYDINGEYINEIYPTGGTRQNPFTFTTGSNVYYVRVQFAMEAGATESIDLNEVQFVQLEEGPVGTDYVPHALDVVELTNRRFVQDWESRNIADATQLINGTLDQYGVLNTSSTRLSTGFMKVDPYSVYTLRFQLVSGLSLPSITWYRYNSLKEFQAFSGGLPYDTSNGAQLVTGATTAYIRFTFVFDPSNVTPASMPKIQLEKGVNASPFTPYALSIAELTSRRFIQDYDSKNLFDISSLEQGTIDLPGGINRFSYSYVRSAKYIAVEPATTYTFTCNLVNPIVWVWEYDSVKSYLTYGGGQTTGGAHSYTFNTGANTRYIRINIGNENLTPNIAVNNISYTQLEKGPYATSLERWLPTLTEFADKACFSATTVKQYSRFIAPSSNLNSFEYFGNGEYYCDSNETAASLVSCPTTDAFKMIVFNMIENGRSVAPTGGAWHVVRYIISYHGPVYYQEIICSNGTVTTAAAWKKFADYTASAKSDFKEKNKIQTSTGLMWYSDVDITTTGGGGYYAFDACLTYSNSRPIAVVVRGRIPNNSYRHVFCYQEMSSTETVTYLHACGVAFIGQDYTFEVWGKYADNLAAANSTNSVSLRITKIQ